MKLHYKLNLVILLTILSCSKPNNNRILVEYSNENDAYSSRMLWAEIKKRSVTSEEITNAYFNSDTIEQKVILLDLALSLEDHSLVDIIINESWNNYSEKDIEKLFQKKANGIKDQIKTIEMKYNFSFREKLDPDNYDRIKQHL